MAPKLSAIDGGKKSRSRAASPPPPMGHNVAAPVPTKEELEAAEKSQLISFLGRLRDALKIKADKKTAYDAAATSVNEIFALAKAAKFSRKELTELLADGAARNKDLVAAEERRRKLRTFVGLPVGDAQLDMFADEKVPDAEKDKAHWKMDGYRAGLAADEPKPPSECNVPQEWMKSYHMGQAENAKLTPAQAAEAATPEAEPTPGELQAKITRKEVAKAKEALDNIGKKDGAEVTAEAAPAADAAPAEDAAAEPEAETV